MLTILKRLRMYLYMIATPAHCYVCKKLLSQYVTFCDVCRLEMKPVVSEKVAITALHSMTVFAFSSYDGPLIPLIRAKNYHDLLASVYLGKLMADQEVIKNLDFDYIVPVPLHWSRRLWRGFNQAEVMAQQISQVTHKPVVMLVLRKKRTVFQFSLKRTERQENLKESFCLTKNAVLWQNKKCLIIDDLMTSGATLKSLAKTLLPLKPEKIFASVAARVVR